jgi:YegS/Rv2252/BmrU family lipid kinase
MDNIFVLVNPAAANESTRGVWPQIAAAMENKGLKFEHHMTSAALQATEVVREALRKGFTTIVAVGGDGTANEVVNGFFDGETPINPQARLAIISRGTGCDLIRTLDIPKDYEGAIEVIARNQEKTMDLGLVEYQTYDGAVGLRWFANIADAGLGGTVCHRVNNKSKSAGGFLSFLSGTVWSILSYKNGFARVEADGELIFEGLVTMAAVANGRYFGGGMHLAPQASINDGKLDLVLLRGMNKLALLGNLARIYKGTHLTHPKISIHAVSEVKVTGENPMPLELDGETPGIIPVRFMVRPGAIKVVC